MGSYTISSINFISANTGFAVGGVNERGFLMKTSNGGNSWDTLISSKNHWYYRDIYFLTSDIVFIFGQGIIIKSTNGGNNWYEVDPSNAGFMTKMSFGDLNTGYVVSDVLHQDDDLYKTTNGGENWFYIGRVFPYYGNFLHFVNPNTGYSVIYELHKTTNGGLNWSIIPTGLYSARDMHVFENKMLTVGPNGDIMESTDGFTTFSPISQKFTNEGLHGSFFLNSANGYCLSSRTIFKTSSAGDSWSVSADFADSNIQLSQIYFLDQNTGILGGNTAPGAPKPKLWRTFNGGENWQLVFYDTLEQSTYISDIFFTQDNSIGFAVGAGNVFKTTNRGITWINKTPPNSADEGFFGVSMHGNNIIISSGHGNETSGIGMVYHSSNGGDTWNGFTLPSTHFLFDIQFLNENTGYICGNKNTVLKTTTGGKTANSWFTVAPSFDPDEEYLNIEFLDVNTGYIAERRGALIKTTNGGQSWEQQISDERFFFRSVSFTDYNTGYLFGNEGTILKTTTGGTIGITNISLETPSSFRLHQNYPNPFNPTTKIRFHVPNNKEFIKLVIYDITGREIVRLVNQELSPGIYEYDFDGKGLSSGIYFYKLEAGDFIETRKMVLVK